MNWNKWIRQTHRWLSMAFTVAVIINIVAIAQNPDAVLGSGEGQIKVAR